MRTLAKSGRVYLDQEAAEKLNEMVRALGKESSHLNLSTSKLTSLILREYSEKYFSRDKKDLTRLLFDKKSYIKHLLSSTESPDELINSVLKLRESRPKTRKKTSGKCPKGAENSENKGASQ